MKTALNRTSDPALAADVAEFAAVWRQLDADGKAFMTSACRAMSDLQRAEEAGGAPDEAEERLLALAQDWNARHPTGTGSTLVEYVTTRRARRAQGLPSEEPSRC